MKFITKRADWIFLIPSTLIFVFGLVVIVVDFFVVQEYNFQSSHMALIGLISMILGVTVRRIARMALKGHFAYGLKILENHQLVQHGIYKYIRHPAYLGSLLFSFGVPFFFSSIAGCLIMLLMIPFILYKIKVEESMLFEEFGEEFSDYRNKSKKLIPYIY